MLFYLLGSLNNFSNNYVTSCKYEVAISSSEFLVKLSGILRKLFRTHKLNVHALLNYINEQHIVFCQTIKTVPYLSG